MTWVGHINCFSGNYSWGRKKLEVILVWGILVDLWIAYEHWFLTALKKVEGNAVSNFKKFYMLNAAYNLLYHVMS